MTKKYPPRKKQTPKWKQFEALVAKIQQAFSPDANVKLNDMIIGRRSGIPRQIDISIRKSIGQYKILVVVECKDYSKPVDVKDVEDFLGLADDVGANKGAMVAANGFTEAAKTRAKDAGVDVYRLVDAEDHDWHSDVAIPMVCDFRSLGFGNFKIGGSKVICEELATRNPSKIAIYDEHHEFIGTSLSLLWAMWNRREISDEPGTQRILLKPDPMLVKSQDGHYEQIEILGQFEVLKKLYFGGLPLTKASGFMDETTGNLVLPGNFEIITDVLDMIAVERFWHLIPSVDILAVKPVMVLTAFDYYPAALPSNPDFPEDERA